MEENTTRMLTNYTTNQLTAWCTVFPKKLTGLQLLKKFPATYPYPEPDNFNILPSTPGSSKQSHSLKSYHQNSA